MIVSRPGYVASPALAEQHKIMDSEWGYAGLLIASGITSDPAPPWQGDPSDWATTSSADWTISFPPLNYVPTIMMFSEASNLGERGWHWFNNRYPLNNNGYVLFNISVETDKIRLSRRPALNAGTYWRLGGFVNSSVDFQYRLLYHVYAWS